MSAQESLFPGGWGRPMLDPVSHRFPAPYSTSLCGRASITAVNLLATADLSEHHRLCSACLAAWATTATLADLEDLYDIEARGITIVGHTEAGA